MIPNKALAPFQPLIGEWSTTNSHPLLPHAELPGRASFEWVEGGAFLLMRQEVDHPQFPKGIAIFGSDNVVGTFSMLYFDSRSVSRIQHVSMSGNELRWWRDEPSFRQRYTFTIAEDGQEMRSSGEMSREGGPWGRDLQTVYRRLR